MIAVEPWTLASFVAVVLATVLGGLGVGLVAAALNYILQVALLPTIVPAAAGVAGGQLWLIELLVVSAAVALGAVVRATLRSSRQRLAAHLPTPTTAGGETPPGRQGRPGPRLTAVERRWIETLGGAVDELTGTRTAVQIADTIARHVVEVTGAVGAAVHLRADPSDALALVARVGDLPATIADPLAGDGPPRDAVRANRTIRDGGRLAIPIVVDAGVIGVVDVHGLEPASGGDAAVLAETIARLGGHALERTHLRSARRTAALDASSSAGRVASLGRLTSDLVAATSIDVVARVVVDRVVEDLGAGFCLLYAIDPRTGGARLAHGRGYPTGLAARDAQVELSADDPVGRAARTGQMIHLASHDAWRRAFPGSSDVLAMTGTRALTAIPLRTGELLRGVVLIGWRRAADGSDLDLELLGAVTDQAGQALERATLHAQDEEARRLQEAFIGVVSHELRTPITTILAGSRLLRRRLAQDSPAAGLADDVAEEADRLARIVEDLLVLSRLERQHLTLAEEPVHLTHLVGRVTANEARRWPTARITVSTALPVAVVRGEETYIEQVLRNLLSNAVKYSPPGALVEVEIRTDGAEVAVCVLDEGPGVARSEVEQLFSLFYRSPSTAASAAGAGIGLYVSRQLVDQMGGRMWARPRPTGGSEFGFALSAYPFDEEGDAGSADGAGTATEREAPRATIGSSGYGPDGEPAPGVAAERSGLATRAGTGAT